LFKALTLQAGPGTYADPEPYI